jgi:hypothetical protein
MKYGLMIIGGLFAIFNMTGCGGSGADNSTTNKASLNGVAAVGAPLANAVVTIKDANDKTSSTTTSSTGNYSFGDLTGFVAPLLIQATGTAGGTEYVLHSVLDAVPAQGVTGTLNTNPASDAITTQAFASPPAQVFADAAKIKALRTDQLTKTKAAVTAALADTMKALSIDAKTDLMTTSFTANSTGVDKILDLVDFSNQRASTASKDQDIKISLKSTGQAVTVTPNSTAATVAKVAAPSDAEASLDLSGIKTLVSKTSDLMKTQNLINSDAFANSFSDAYLDQGQTKSEILSQIRNGLVGATLSDYVIKRCDGATKICFGTLTLTKKDGYISNKVMPVIYANGQWQFYGNQAKFSFEISPAYQEHYSVSGGKATLFIQQTGLNIYIPGSRIYGGNREYVAGRLYLSFDGGQNYEPLNDGLQFKVLDGCEQGLISAKNFMKGECDNFVDFSDQTQFIDDFNAANESGLLKMKLKLYKNTDMSDASPIETPLVFPTMFTKERAAAAMIDSGLGVNDADLGSSERLRFTGSNFDFLNVTMKSNANLLSQSNWQHTFGNNLEVKALRNDLTLEKFKNNCTGCTITGDAIFTRIDLQMRDRQGRQLTIHKSLPNQ